MINREFWLVCLLALVLVVILVPVCKLISSRLNIYAGVNERTIHKGKISRLGGVAFFLVFILLAGTEINITEQLGGILLGSAIMFLTGLVDDVYNLKPIYKIIMQVIASVVLIMTGTCLGVIRLPFGMCIEFGLTSVLFTIAWVMVITNALNLMDGLDGLAGGMSSIILATIAFTALIEGKLDIFCLCVLLVVCVMGFLLYNVHPASIFMGDCGSMFLGFFIASISLMGFKSSTVMTLALPILMMVIPIADVIAAILRRTLKHKRFSEADREHLHHHLLDRFGQVGTVIIMCGMTAVFGFSAFIYLISREMGLVIMVFTVLILELVIEKNGVISEKFHPVISIIKKFFPKRT